MTRKKPLQIELGAALRGSGIRIATAESCTGGILSGMITEIAGSSDYFIGGIIAYSNDIKKEAVGVKASTLKNFGAVSKETAIELSEGVRKRFKTDIGVSITGIAGPGGGSPEKPVGTVFIGISKSKKAIVKKFLFKGTRRSIRKASADAALKMLLESLGR